jgi:hypothetical protein
MLTVREGVHVLFENLKLPFPCLCFSFLAEFDSSEIRTSCPKYRIHSVPKSVKVPSKPSGVAE